jgi:hypothetical protein
MRLGFDQDATARAGKNGVPTPQVTGDWYRNLGPPSRSRRKALPKARKESEVSSISNGIPVRIQRSGQLHADYRGYSRDQIDRHRGGIAAFQSNDRFGAHARAASNLPNAQASHAPRDVELVAEPQQ